MTALNHLTRFLSRAVRARGEREKAATHSRRTAAHRSRQAAEARSCGSGGRESQRRAEAGCVTGRSGRQRQGRDYWNGVPRRRRRRWRWWRWRRLSGSRSGRWYHANKRCSCGGTTKSDCRPSTLLPGERVIFNSQYDAAIEFSNYESKTAILSLSPKMQVLV